MLYHYISGSNYSLLQKYRTSGPRIPINEVECRGFLNGMEDIMMPEPTNIILNLIIFIYVITIIIFSFLPQPRYQVIFMRIRVYLTYLTYDYDMHQIPWTLVYYHDGIAQWPDP